MRKISIFICILFGLFLASPFLVAAQTMNELPYKTAEEAKEQVGRAMAETERLRAELARLQAEQQVSASKLKTFSISLDCNTYKESPEAYNNCMNAQKEASPHERSHMINAMCRRRYFNDTAHLGKGNCIQVGWTEDEKGVRLAVMTWIPEPANTSIKGLESSGCVPGFLKTCVKYNNYLVKSQNPPPGITPWRNIGYLYDEGGAYNIGAAQYLQDALKNKSVAFAQVIEGPIAFTVIGASVAQYTQKTNPDYFKSAEFRAFLKQQIEFSMKIVRDAFLAQAQKNIFGDSPSEPSRSVLINFRNSSQADLLKKMYGEDWFNGVFDIEL